jgi:hypothetical protein|tara:strand:+ start:1960 stop:2298 length:339 start_codon:yes stop_codon:yes gene_type:complete
MFWRSPGIVQASPVDGILDRESFTLDDLLDEDDLIQECKSLNSRLVDLCVTPSTQIALDAPRSLAPRLDRSFVARRRRRPPMRAHATSDDRSSIRPRSLLSRRPPDRSPSPR